ncbi:MAG: hypothetical protein K2X82_26970, partial [Gemmataceae bacterium]|nr:hypothetical protein [Gemmataceae bacterium]
RLRAAADDRARQAELDRVRAEGDLRAAGVKAAEGRKRRRAQFALAGAVGLLVLGAGAVVWGVRDSRQAQEAEERNRRAAAVREVNRAVEDAATALERATRAGRDPVLWSEALAAARRARGLAAAGYVPAEVRSREAEVWAGAEQGEKNRRLVAALLDIPAGMGDRLNVAGGQDYPVADARYSAAFREYGVDPFALAPEVAADLLGRLGNDVRVELAAALDDWAYVRPSALVRRGGADAPRDRAGFYRSSAPLARITQRLDPDPVRNRLREAVAGGDMEAIGRVAAGLAGEVDPAAQPAQTVNLVAVFINWYEPPGLDLAARFLRRAQPHHSGDFQINHNLAFFLIRQRRFADALPHAAAAVAVRPVSAAAWDDYAQALAGVGRTDEAVAAHRRVVALSPETLSSRVFVIELLARAGDRDGAAAARAELERAVKAPIDAASAYFRLGYDEEHGGDLGRAVRLYAEALQHLPKDPRLRAALDRARRLLAERTAPPPRPAKP